MFSLIISIIAIALVVVLLAATMYAGGDTLTDAKAHAEATQLKNQEQQILAAVDFFHAEQHRYPASLEELVTFKYLSAIPSGIVSGEVASLRLVSTAEASTSGWDTVAPGQPVFRTNGLVSQQTCRKFNLLSRGDDGILRVAYAGLRAQCYGDDGGFSVLIHKVGAVSLEGLLTSETIRPGKTPAPDNGADWLVLPTNDLVPANPGTNEPEPEPERETSIAVLVTAANITLEATQESGTAVTARITYRNEGNAPMTLMPSELETPLSAAGACINIPELGECDVIVTLNPGPMRDGVQTLTMSGADIVPAAVTLHWKVSAAVARWGETNVDFGSTQIGTPVQRTVTLFNDGNSTGNWSSSNLTGNLPAQFVLDLSGCSAVVADGYCSVPITFSPIAAGTVHASNLAVAGSMSTNVLNLVGAGQEARYAAGQFSKQSIQGGMQGAAIFHMISVTNNTGSNLYIVSTYMNSTLVSNMSEQAWPAGAKRDHAGPASSGASAPSAAVRIVLSNGQTITAAHSGVGVTINP